MKQKIEWYKEVLEIEPNSKIFFPLARMLSKDTRQDEAVAVLRQGVGRHPDHVEARLFLAELLYSTGRVIELQQEIAVLSDLFKNYPGFWRAWGEKLFDEDSTRDAGLAAIFLAAFLQNLPVSWAGVIEHGLKNLVGESPKHPSVTAREVYPLTPDLPLPEKSIPPEVVSIPPSMTLAAPPEVRAVMSDIHKIMPESHEAGPVTIPETPFEENEEEVDEPITLRTRSMAEVLAEQGDIAGALDIYNELLTSAVSDSDKNDLQTRVNSLSSNTPQSAGQVNMEDASASKEEKKDWLTILAQRLEARSLQ